MKNLIILFVGILFFTLTSCENTDSVDMSLLLDYNFQYANIEELGYKDIVETDTILVSFENVDTVFAYRKIYQRIGAGKDTLITNDTIFRKYIIEGHNVYFTVFDYNILYDSEDLLDLMWEVVSISDQDLKINLPNVSGINPAAVLKCVEK